MSNTSGRTQAPPENGWAQMFTLIPPVSANARRFWSWYCQRSPIAGFQTRALAGDDGRSLGDGVEEQATRNANRTTIESKVRGTVLLGESDGVVSIGDGEPGSIPMTGTDGATR